MADTQEPTVGYKGEFHLHDGTSLYKLKGVTSIQIPGRGNREQVVVDDLDTPNWRHEYLDTWHEDVDFAIGVRTRVLTDTDDVLDEADAERDVRAFKVVIPQAGVPFAQITGTCKSLGYDRGTIEIDAPIDGTATFRVVTIDDIAPYEEPA